jgi:DNA-binding NarL/FixJ family response regulator
MPKTIARGSGQANGLAVGPVNAALLAPAAVRDEVLEALRQEDLRVSAFDGSGDLLGAAAEQRVDLVLLWVADTTSGLGESIEAISEQLPETPIVVLCPSIERWGIRAALTAGASGVVLSERLESALIPCIRAALTDQVCVPREHRRQVEPPVLSAREKQVLGLVVMGYSNGAIAEQLFLAESTVKSHLSSAFGKLGVRSRNEAVKAILDADRGLGMGILALGGEPLEQVPA